MMRPAWVSVSTLMNMNICTSIRNLEGRHWKHVIKGRQSYANEDAIIPYKLDGLLVCFWGPSHADDCMRPVAAGQFLNRFDNVVFGVVDESGCTHFLTQHSLFGTTVNGNNLVPFRLGGDLHPNVTQAPASADDGYPVAWLTFRLAFGDSASEAESSAQQRSSNLAGHSIWD